MPRGSFHEDMADECHIRVRKAMVRGREDEHPWTARFARGCWARCRLPPGLGPATGAELLAGLRHPTNGSVQVDGLDLGELGLDQLAEWRAACVALCRVSSLLPDTPAIVQVELALARRGQGREGRRRQALALLHHWQLQPEAEAFPPQLSRRQLRRLLMARATAQEPELVVVHEPGWRGLLAVLQRTLREHGCFAPTIVILRPGRSGPRRAGLPELSTSRTGRGGP